MAMQFKYRALVVDDDSGIRNVTTMVLQVNNYDVLSAENGIAAIPILKNTRPHVMISDLRMPDMNGYELLRMARRFFPAMGTVVVSALETEAPGRDLADAVFAKGEYSVPELLECVSELAGRYPLLRPSLKTAVSPSWVSQNDGRNFWAACNGCLTCFSLPLSQVGYSGMHRAYCPSCGQKIRFMMQQAHSNAMAIAA
ncbi:MAG TPA: response regulator [Candidatus Angelobacter sp.]|jgi:CheY-like chemotaxis protein|nr:response regulator [Candidatus Angelobacter sp.]